VLRSTLGSAVIKQLSLITQFKAIHITHLNNLRVLKIMSKLTRIKIAVLDKPVHSQLLSLYIMQEDSSRVRKLGARTNIETNTLPELPKAQL
jgi:hypothetical protein